MAALMKKKITVSVFALLLILFVFSIPPVEDGKMIFSSRCASCHNVNKIVLGPALAGVTERHSEDWIIHFVHSSQAVIKGGDQSAVALYEKFNKVPMPDHLDLSPESIKGILAYIKSETKAPAKELSFRPERIHPLYTPILSTNYLFFASYLGLVILMAVALVALVKVKEIQRHNRNNQH
jgi:cytochrome c551/c552